MTYTASHNWHRLLLFGNLTRAPANLNGSTRSSVQVSFGKTLQGPNLVWVKPGKDMNNVNCRRDITEIMLNVA